MSFQRLQYKNAKQGKKTLLSDERRGKLEEHGFIFVVKEDDPSSTWNIMLDELYRYKSQNKDCNVPATYHTNRRLAAWVRYLRKLYADRQGGDADAALELNDDRIRVLEGMGLTWTGYEGSDVLPLELDGQYFESFKGAMVPPPPGGASSGDRTTDGKTMTGFRRNDGAWNLRLEELRHYKQTHGTCNVNWKGKSVADPVLSQLGKWISKQRSEYRKFQAGKKSQITQERIDALAELEFDWAPGNVIVDWSVRLEQLKEFRKGNGHCNVPKSYGPNPSLGQWVQTQRVYYKKLKAGKPTHMTDERRSQLEEVGFQWHVGTGRKSQGDDAAYHEAARQEAAQYEAARHSVTAAAEAAAEIAVEIAAQANVSVGEEGVPPSVDVTESQV